MSMTESRPHGRSGPIAGPGVGRHLLIVDDDDRIRELLKEFLAREGYRVTGAAHAAAARRLMELIEFDLVVLDIMMPGESGLDFARWLRGQSNVPIVMLTAMGEETDRIVGLELGADDYVPKPSSPGELVARLRAIMRRVQPVGQPLTEVIKTGALVLWPGKRQALWQGRELGVTSTEFSLLEELARSAGQVVSKQDLSLNALGCPLTRYDRRIDVHISSIRQKLGPRPDAKAWIQSVRGLGYLLIAE